MDDPAEKFYIILEGSVNVIIEISDKKKTTMVTVAQLHSGMSFGELALLKDQPRSATILCNTDCHFAVLGKGDYMKIIGKAEMRILDRIIDFLGEIPFFAKWGKKKLGKLTYYLDKKKFKRKQVVFKHDSQADYVYVVKSGEFEISRPMLAGKNQDKNKGFMVKVALLSKGEIFCENEVMDNRNSDCMCTCYSTEGELYRIPAENFKLVFALPYDTEERKGKLLRNSLRESRISNFEYFLKSDNLELALNSVKKPKVQSYSPVIRTKYLVEPLYKAKLAPLNEYQLTKIKNRAMGSIKSRRQYIHINTPLGTLINDEEYGSVSHTMHRKRLNSSDIFHTPRRYKVNQHTIFKTFDNINYS